MFYSLLLVFSSIFITTLGCNSDWKQDLGWDGLADDPFSLGIPLLYPPFEVLFSTKGECFLIDL